MDQCSNCQFFDRQNKSQGVGQCRRHAPSLSPINAKAYMIEGVWPTIRDDDWCGEWKSVARKAEPRLPEFMTSGHTTATAPPVRPLSQVAMQTGTALVRGND